MRREGVTHGRQEKYVTDTDIESMQYSPKQGRTGHHRGSEKQEHSKKKQIEHIAKPDPVKPIKIYTFLLKHTRKRFNVVCYSDKDLCIPIRFAKKLIKVDVDNDAESEKEMIEEEVKRGEQVLREAILVNQNSQIK